MAGTETFWDGGERQELTAWVSSLPLEQETMLRALRSVLVARGRITDLRHVAHGLAVQEAATLRQELELDAAYQEHVRLTELKQRYPFGDLTDQFEPSIWN